MRVYASLDTYALCPACNRPLDREYINYCYLCGQHLAWNQFAHGKIHEVKRREASQQKNKKANIALRNNGLLHNYPF